MKSRYIFVFALLLFCSLGLSAQLGIKAGVNMANELKSFSSDNPHNGFSSNNLTGYQIGLIYQFMPAQSGLGCELGALLSQKGSSFNDSDSTNASIGYFIKQGYSELNYLEVPFCFRYRLSLGLVGVYGTAGIYAGYALNGKTVNESTSVAVNRKYPEFIDHLDYGYNFGGGLELFRKIQFGATWSQGLKNTATTIVGPPVPTKSINKVFSINLVYLF
jgi:hypothetical protein